MFQWFCQLLCSILRERDKERVGRRVRKRNREESKKGKADCFLVSQLGLQIKLKCQAFINNTTTGRDRGEREYVIDWEKTKREKVFRSALCQGSKIVLTAS